jgi:hypothetical protein
VIGNYSSLLALSLGNDLLFVEGWLSVAQGDLVGRKLVVAVLDGIELAVHGGLVQWVEGDLGVLSSLHGNSGGSTGDVRWEHLKSHN